MDVAEEVYRAYNDAENAHDMARVAGLVADGLVVTVNGQPALGSAEDDRRATVELLACYPDYRREVVDVVADGARAAVRWRMVGTPTATVAAELGPLDLHGCSVVTVADGRIVSASLYVDEEPVRRIIERARVGQP